MTRLNDSHAQLMVHWLGEGTNVMLCLAREPPPSYLDDPKSAIVSSSSVYISYDNGDTFFDKTLMFTVNVTNGTTTVQKNSTLDQFITHPNYNTVRDRAARSMNRPISGASGTRGVAFQFRFDSHSGLLFLFHTLLSFLQIVFTDARNKAIFTNSDFGRTIQKHMVDFTPSDVSFYEHDKRTFLVLDKEDPDRKVSHCILLATIQHLTIYSNILRSYTTRLTLAIHLMCFKATSNRLPGQARAMEAPRCICMSNERNRQVSFNYHALHR